MRIIIEKKIYLESEEVGKVMFSARFISDRQTRTFYKENDVLYETSFLACYRRDMFWIDCFLDEENFGTFSVEPSRVEPEKFSIGKNYCNVQCEQYGMLVRQVTHWFKQQPEYQQQIEWNRNLIANEEKDRSEGFFESRPVKQ